MKIFLLIKNSTKLQSAPPFHTVSLWLTLFSSENSLNRSEIVLLPHWYFTHSAPLTIEVILISHHLWGKLNIYLLLLFLFTVIYDDVLRYWHVLLDAF